MKKSDQINELAEALAKAQKAFESAERGHVAKVNSKKGEGSSYTFNYADLAAYLEVCRGPLGEHGLSFVQEPTCDGHIVSVTTLLMHQSGQWIESEPLRLALTGETLTPQVIGSGITYARRYSLSAITGMASEQDDDGNAASGNTAETAKRETMPACPKCGTNANVIRGKAEYGGGFLCFAKKGGCGEKWADAQQQATAKDANGHSGQSSFVASKSAADPTDWKGLVDLLKAIGVPEGDMARANAVVKFAAPKLDMAACFSRKGACRQVLEKLTDAQAAGQSLDTIYNDALAQAGLLTELEKQGAERF